jgi:hypothetical protein
VRCAGDGSWSSACLRIEQVSRTKTIVSEEVTALDLILSSLGRLVRSMGRLFGSCHSPANSSCFIAATTVRSERCAALVDSKHFDTVVVFLIVSNAVVMAMPYEGMSKAYAYGLDVGDQAFICLFTVEALLKVMGHGIRTYFSLREHLFDSLVNIVSWVSVIITYLPGDDSSGLDIVRVFRLFRALRLGRLLYKNETIKRLLDTVFSSTVAIINVANLMLFSIGLFAVIGMQLFGGKFPADERNTDYYSTASQIHFDDFGNAILALFVILTGDNWNEILWNAMHGKENAWAAPIFFIGFFAYSHYILLNLFVAIILENFELSEALKASKQHENWKKKKRQAMRRRESSFSCSLQAGITALVAARGVLQSNSSFRGESSFSSIQSQESAASLQSKSSSRSSSTRSPQIRRMSTRDESISPVPGVDGQLEECRFPTRAIVNIDVQLFVGCIVWHIRRGEGKIIEIETSGAADGGAELFVVEYGSGDKLSYTHDQAKTKLTVVAFVDRKSSHVMKSFLDAASKSLESALREKHLQRRRIMDPELDLTVGPHVWHERHGLGEIVSRASGSVTVYFRLAATEAQYTEEQAIDELSLIVSARVTSSSTTQASTTQVVHEDQVRQPITKPHMEVENGAAVWHPERGIGTVVRCELRQRRPFVIHFESDASTKHYSAKSVQKLFLVRDQSQDELAAKTTTTTKPRPAPPVRRRAMAITARAPARQLSATNTGWLRCIAMRSERAKTVWEALTFPLRKHLASVSRSCQAISKHPHFSNALLVVIMISSGFLAGPPSIKRVHVMLIVWDCRVISRFICHPTQPKPRPMRTRRSFFTRTSCSLSFSL